MSERVTMPALGESVTEGTVTRWLKNVGDSVAVDEPLLEVSTDKVDTEIPSPVAGTLQEILVAEDETVAVGTDLAVIGGGEAAAAESTAPMAEPTAQQASAAPVAEQAPAATAPPQEASEPAAQEPVVEAAAAAPAAEEPAAASGGELTGGTAVTMPALGFIKVSWIRLSTPKWARSTSTPHARIEPLARVQPQSRPRKGQKQRVGWL